MAKSKIMVKRRGRMEEYDDRKIYASVYAAALNAHMGERAAEELAHKVAAKVDKRLQKKDPITSEAIRDMIFKELGGEDNDVAFLYKHHLDLN